MKRLIPTLAAVALATSFGCAGGDDTENKNNGGTNNGTVNNGGTNNGTVNNGGTNNGGTNNGTANNGGTNNGAAVCGDGVVNGTEACDNAIADGQPGACPTGCAGADQCAPATLQGSASDCTAQCVSTTIVACSGGDGCCPSNCTSTTDSDCPSVCGNGVIEGNELCDGGCPTSCDDGDMCTTDTMTGSAATCDAVCSNVAITACVDGDGCCPNGCDASNDAECGGTCGNGTVEPGETCDGNCATSCDDGNACTTDRMTGSAAGCDVVCTNMALADNACANGDGCCPAACNETNDDDCSSTCGNGVVEMGETCDGNCPASCDDGNACTNDSTTGSAGNCNLACQNVAISVCQSGDGCCPASCNSVLDSDCSVTCGNGVVEGTETCDGNCPAACDDGNACTIDTMTGSSANCNVVCGSTAITACTDNDGCCAPGCLAADDNDCTQSGAIGDACNSAGECMSGACFGDPVTDGYCSALCIDDTDCPSGSHCGFVNDDGFGVCLDDCAGDADCRAGDYACFDADEAGTNECWAVGSGTGAPGAACDTHSDCAGGNDGWCVHDSNGWQDGTCVQRCTSADPCPTGAHCSLFDTNTGRGVCLPDCGSDADCRADGYLCFDLDSDAVTECAAAATGAGAVGDPCTQAYDCGGGTDGGCFTQGGGWRNGYCTELCNVANNTCPAGSHCGAVDAAGDGVCLKDCAGNGQCRLDGYLCLEADGDAASTTECWPAATGTGQVGDPCNGYWECVGGEWGGCITSAAWPDGYCTILCGVGEGGCTTDSVCEDVNDVCVKSCSTDGECRTGYECATLTPSDGCWPL